MLGFPGVEPELESCLREQDTCDQDGLLESDGLVFESWLHYFLLVMLLNLPEPPCLIFTMRGVIASSLLSCWGNETKLIPTTSAMQCLAHGHCL
jgi:hypothetical protein